MAKRGHGDSPDFRSLQSPFWAIIAALLVAENGDYSRQCRRRFRKYIMADSIPDSIRIRIVTPDSIRYSIRTKTADSQVPNLTAFKMVAASRHGFLHYMNFDGKSVCGTPFSASVSNLMQIHATMAEIWRKMWFSIWQLPPSWILSYTSSEGKHCPGTNSRCLYQIWCESVQKC